MNNNYRIILRLPKVHAAFEPHPRGAYAVGRFGYLDIHSCSICCRPLWSPSRNSTNGCEQTNQANESAVNMGAGIVDRFRPGKQTQISKHAWPTSISHRLANHGLVPQVRHVSRALPVVCLWSFFRPAMRSPRTVQQMQPLFISMMFSCGPTTSAVQEELGVAEWTRATFPIISWRPVAHLGYLLVERHR